MNDQEQLRSRVKSLEAELSTERNELRSLRLDYSYSFWWNWVLIIALLVAVCCGTYQTSMNNNLQATLYKSGNYTLSVAQYLEELAAGMRLKARTL